MKKQSFMRVGFALAIISLFMNGCVSLPSVTEVSIVPQSPSPGSVIDVMTRVADWQLAHPFEYHIPTNWRYGTYWAGLTAWAVMSDDEKYMNALRGWGEENAWRLGEKTYDSNGHCVGQMYLDLYRLYQQPEMLTDSRDRFSLIIETWPQEKIQSGKDLWWWVDSLFMSPPVWSSLSAITGQIEYLEFMDKEWRLSKEQLYDQKEHLYYRDFRFIEPREPNGKKIFWGRGNGWIYAGLVRVLEHMPEDFPSRGKYIELYRQLSDRIVSLQPEDGLWRSSLLDPESYPDPESSGTAFFCYGLAWGVNRGILNEKKYLNAILSAWNGLTNVCVHEDGMLGYVQDIGAFPTKVSFDETAIYGVGAFLLAGSEVYKLALHSNSPSVTIKCDNESLEFRSETVISIKQGRENFAFDWPRATRMGVFDLNRNRFIPSRTRDNDNDGESDEILTQVDFAPGQQKYFWIMPLPENFSKPDLTEQSATADQDSFIHCVEK